MTKWIVRCPTEPVLSCFVIEADGYQQAVEEAKELWCEQADDLAWEAEEEEEHRKRVAQLTREILPPA